ncbi:sensor histidine kinase [Candidatus Hydrogenedentota bacterium]
MYQTNMSRTLPIAVGCISASLLVLVGILLIFPVTLETVTANIVPILALLAVIYGVLAFLSRNAGVPVRQLTAISQALEAGTGETGLHLQENVTHPELMALTAGINGLLEEHHEAKRSSFDLLASNRVLGRDVARIFQLLDSVVDGILAVDAVGRIILANRASASFLNVPLKEVLNTLALEALKDEAVRELLVQGQDDKSGYAARTIELPADKDTGRGETSVLQCSNADTGEKPVGEVLVFRDITRLKDIERTQREFVDSVAHELRTPLTSIRASVEMLIDDEAPDPQTKYNFYNVISEEAYRLTQLIDNLLNISQMESGAGTLNATPTRMKSLIEDSLDVVRPQCENKDIKLIVDLPDRLPTLDIDKSLFNVALMNLLGNAVKYTPGGGSITLATSSNDDEFAISIQDTGVGISQEELPRIFDKFYRCASAEEEETVSGSGIGLATARQIVGLHGGEISVVSKPGEGSRFVIELPRTLINTAIGD